MFAAAADEPEPQPDFQSLLGFDDEQVADLRATVQKDPREIMTLIEPFVRENQELAQYLISNLEDFVKFLHNVNDDEDDDLDDMDQSEAIYLDISEEEQAAITRLTELGFDRQVVTIAYFACDKNEELAANYLLEHGEDD